MASVVLVVEPDDGMRAVLGELLRLEGHRVVVADSLTAARTVLFRQSVDLILTETMSARWDPDLPGLADLRWRAPRTPMVLFTGFTQARELEASVHGLEAIRVKPLDLECVLRDVQGILERVPAVPAFALAATRASAFATPALALSH